MKSSGYSFLSPLFRVCDGVADSCMPTNRADSSAVKVVNVEPAGGRAWAFGGSGSGCGAGRAWFGWTWPGFGDTSEVGRS